MLNIAAKARPYLGAVILTTALLTAGGIYSASRMASGVYPEVTFPRIAVVGKKPGLDLLKMEIQVTRPLEEAVSTVIGVSRVRCKTIRGGCDLSIDLAPGTNMDRAEQLVWNRIGSVRSQMPPDIELNVEQMTPSVFPIISLVLTGGDSPAQLREYALYQLAPKIKNINDVGRAEVAGSELREIEVEARPNDLLAAGLSAADLADQIAKAHRLEPVGRIERRPFAFQVLVNNQVTSARDLEDLVIQAKNGQPLHVRDVAEVKVAYQDRVSSVGFRMREGVVVTVFRRPGGNTVSISNELHELLKNQPPPAHIRATVVYDQAQFVNAAVDNVRDAIVIGSIFSIIILLLFLRSWRATLISALALPTTLAITCLFLYWVRETWNLMTLGGLAVAIGLIIDDTVVVIENIARHLTHKPAGEVPRACGGDDPIDAASAEITGAVVGSTLTTVLVFVPLAFISGVYGQFFASLSWSLSIAVLVSMVISLTLVPVVAAKFLAGRPMPEPGPIYRALAEIYEWMLSMALKVPRLTMTASLGAIFLGVLLYTGIPNFFAKQEEGKPPPAPLVHGLETGLLPTMDEGAFVLDYWAPSGTPLERTEEMAKRIEWWLLENPDIDVYVRRSGTELGMFATQTNRGDIQIVLRPAEDDLWSLLTKPERPEFGKVEHEEMLPIGKERALAKYGPGYTPLQMWEEGKAFVRQKYRRRPIDKVKDEIKDEVEEHFSEHQLKAELIQIMEDELNDLSGANRPIEVKLFGPDYAELRHLAEEVAEQLEKKGKGRGIKEVISNVNAGNPDLLIEVDKIQAMKLGVPVQEVERQLRAIFLGQVATQVRESAARIIDVRVRYPDRFRFGTGHFNPDNLLSPLILLPAPAIASKENYLGSLAQAVPVSSLATIKRIRTPDEQVRENLTPSIIVTAELNESEAGLGAVVADIKQVMEGIKMPVGYRWELGGHFIQQREAFRSLTIVMVVAILLVFIMLAFQFRSVSLPLLIFMTQPLSLVSGLFALWITHTPLNVSSYMGAILLIGLDMKNGILLVEYIQQLLSEGMELKQALLLAGRTRFRPILMTSLAAILGLFPLALGIGPGAQMQQPLAIMVIGGLTANMLFTRMVIPVGYSLFRRQV